MILCQYFSQFHEQEFESHTIIVQFKGIYPKNDF